MIGFIPNISSHARDLQTWSMDNAQAHCTLSRSSTFIFRKTGPMSRTNSPKSLSYIRWRVFIIFISNNNEQAHKLFLPISVVRNPSNLNTMFFLSWSIQRSHAATGVFILPSEPAIVPQSSYLYHGTNIFIVEMLTQLLLFSSHFYWLILLHLF